MLRERLAAWRTLHWVFAGLALLALFLGVGLVYLVVAFTAALDTEKDLSDFGSPQQARDFVSAHLPLALPTDAAVTELRYERWTDWHLTAKVRFSSARAAGDFVARARAARSLNDAYCGGAEPSAGARFFLPGVAACGNVTSTGDSLAVLCFTL